MRLQDVMGAAGADLGDVDAEIHALAYDNRRVGPGTLFFCVPGFTRDGHDFAADAVARGAVALVVERPLGLGVPEVVVESVRGAMAPAAARFHGDPTAELDVVAITGTNGKTTTAFLVRALLEASGRQCGLLGTVTAFVGGLERAPLRGRTTAEAIDLQRDFRAMRDGGDVACAIEVSSHALELGRADAIHVAAAIFTNLTQDHLDFHPTMDDYFLAKRRLLLPAADEPPRVAVVNVDDPYGWRLAGELRDAGRLPLTFAIDRDASYRAVDVETRFSGSSFTALTPEGPIALSTPLPGRFNVQNVLGAVAAVRALGVPLEAIAAALPQAGRVPGRFEPVDAGQPFAVLVDYAHTPDSLENVLSAARELTAARLHCVFGCGGDRDRGKRPQMGEIAARLADRVVVTSDNPRSEQPQAIVDEILAGVPSERIGLSPSGHRERRPTGLSPFGHRERRPAGDVTVEVDRRAAIALALADAEEGDVVVIAGKGHEQGQELAGGEKVPFDDVTVAREALRSFRPRPPATAR
ncbi:MAG TPA: UDP-N-acetylmuramoyl-L-alanyl-D-glutamate--2,6-diaminopimelate ligase [Conexibacter sp.]|jgi:UDP-N-acetylmuramoyl-L-alanyl-D-glutamate--2,6-diaminopimelate ligase|nr:UDP-N-acetylmuramoyl-L-alanyl-D-glutamate--2,6-diaminopimelate ligase [Conexibacter sp.]